MDWLEKIGDTISGKTDSKTTTGGGTSTTTKQNIIPIITVAVIGVALTVVAIKK